MHRFCLAIVFLAFNTVAAEMLDPEDDSVDMSHYLQDTPYGFLPIPVVITEPAVGYGGGLFGLFLHGKGKQVDNRFIPPAMTAFGGGGHAERYLVCRRWPPSYLAGRSHTLSGCGGVREHQSGHLLRGYRRV